MSSKKKIKIFKIIISIITILLLIGLTLYLFPIISKLFTEQGRESFKTEIDGSGTMGMLMLLGLQAAQIFLPILPGEPIEILAGMCYGTIGGLLFITFSVFVTTTIIFFLVRKFGREFVYGMCSKEKVEKIENSKLFKKLNALHFQLQLFTAGIQNTVLQLLKPVYVICSGKYLYLPADSVGGGNGSYSQQINHNILLITQKP